MMKIFYLGITIIFLTSCTKDFDVTITGVDLNANRNYEDYSEATEFLGPDLFFSAAFSMDPNRAYASLFAPKVGEVNHLNPVLDNQFVLTSNRDILLSNDTLFSGDNLISLFEYKVIKRNFYLRYNFKNTATILNNSGYYTFYFNSILADNTVVSDSCLVKINF